MATVGRLPVWDVANARRSRVFSWFSWALGARADEVFSGILFAIIALLLSCDEV